MFIIIRCDYNNELHFVSSPTMSFTFRAEGTYMVEVEAQRNELPFCSVYNTMEIIVQ